MTHDEKLKVVGKVLKALEGLADHDQRDVLRALTVADERKALRRVLEVTEKLDGADFYAVKDAVSSIFGPEPVAPDA